jgi:hypothetical protein
MEGKRNPDFTPTRALPVKGEGKSWGKREMGVSEAEAIDNG